MNAKLFKVAGVIALIADAAGVTAWLLFRDAF